MRYPFFHVDEKSQRRFRIITSISLIVSLISFVIKIVLYFSEQRPFGLYIFLDILSILFQSFYIGIWTWLGIVGTIMIIAMIIGFALWIFNILKFIFFLIISLFDRHK